jgi:hypothetical protein
MDGSIDRDCIRQYHRVTLAVGVALFKPNKNQYPAIIAAHNSIVGWTWGGDAMDHDTIALIKLKEEMRLRQQRHAAGPRPANEAMTPQIKMMVSNWYTDELGNQARFIQARD